MIGCFNRDCSVELHLELWELVLDVLETEEDWEIDETILLSFFVFFICVTISCKSTSRLFMVLFATIFGWSLSMCLVGWNGGTQLNPDTRTKVRSSRDSGAREKGKTRTI